MLEQVAVQKASPQKSGRPRSDSTGHGHRREERNCLVSVGLPCDGVEPMNVLAQAAGQERFYWQDPRSKVTYVGVGIAANLSAWGKTRFQSIEKQARGLFADARIDPDLPEEATPKLFGGFSFTDDFTPDNTWSIYPPAQFILPHYQFSKFETENGSCSWLTINALLEIGDDWAQAIDDLKSQLQRALEERMMLLRQLDIAATNRAAVLVSRNYPMSFSDWERMLRSAIEQFTLGNLDKVVLSRVCELRFQQNVDVDQSLAFLNQNYPDCFRFVFEPRPYHAFFGATPELLLDLQGVCLSTMALAGSEPRGKTPAEDDVLGQQLLSSPKDRHEHQLVVDALRRRLQPLCNELSIADAPVLLRLSNIQHLYTPVAGKLKSRQSVLKLLQRLHPTPALGGAPSDLALHFISEKEPAPRGWYAAPIGIIDRYLSGTFSVAIRSAVTEYERVWLHAGAGIVSASDPLKEWNETALKFRPILNSLGVSPQ